MRRVVNGSVESESARFYPKTSVGILESAFEHAGPFLSKGKFADVSMEDFSAANTKSWDAPVPDRAAVINHERSGGKGPGGKGSANTSEPAVINTRHGSR